MFYWYARAVKGEHVELCKLLLDKRLYSTVFLEQFGVGDTAFHVPALCDDQKGIAIMVRRGEPDLHSVEARGCQGV